MYIMLNKGFGNLSYIRLCLLCVVALATFDLYCNPPQIDNVFIHKTCSSVPLLLIDIWKRLIS